MSKGEYTPKIGDLYVDNFGEIVILTSMDNIEYGCCIVAKGKHYGVPGMFFYPIPASFLSVYRPLNKDEQK